MRILLQLASLMLLSLFSCAEMSSNSPATLSIIPTSIISSSLEDSFSAEVSVKSVFKERFNIPELVTDDVDENEKELKYILESFSKFSANRDSVYQALRSEFMYRSKFNALLPNLMRYFDRYQPNREKMNDIHVMIKNQKFNYILHEATQFIDLLENMVFQDDKLARGFQEFIVANPQYFSLVRDRFNRTGIFAPSNRRISKWFKVALISNMPKFIFEIFSRYDVYAFEHPCIFTGIFIPKEHHPEIFEKINFLIDNSENEGIRERYRFYNRVRYGPEDPNLFVEIFRPSYGLTDQQELELCYCASMANKMDLFSKLLPYVMPYITRYPNKLKKFSDKSNYVFMEESIEMYKFIFDIQANSDESFRQEIYQRTDFLNIVAKYYRIDYINLNGNDLMLVLKISICAASSEFPVIFAINYQSVPLWKLTHYPEEFIFNRAEVLENYLLNLFKVLDNTPINLNSENLNLVMKSESIRQMVNHHVENSLVPPKPFFVSMDSYMKVNDEEFDFPATDIAILENTFSFLFLKLTTNDQLRKYEVLKSRTLSDLIVMDSYFEYRYIFKYLIENGKELPKYLPKRTRELLEIDFPGINLS